MKIERDIILHRFKKMDELIQHLEEIKKQIFSKFKEQLLNEP